MADYINREKLLEHIKDVPTWEIDDKGVHDTKYPKGMFDCEDVVSSIENAPAADVATVIYAEWELRPSGENGSGEIKAYCTKCGKPNKQYRPPYCPHCGAKMYV